MQELLVPLPVFGTWKCYKLEDLKGFCCKKTYKMRFDCLENGMDSPNQMSDVIISTPQSSTITSRHTEIERVHPENVCHSSKNENSKNKFDFMKYVQPRHIRYKVILAILRVVYCISPWLFGLQVESCWRLMSQRRRNWQKKASWLQDEPLPVVRAHDSP